MKKIPKPGEDGERFRAQPKSPRYYDSSTECPLKKNETFVEVVPVDALGWTARRILADANRAEMQGKPAEAALKFNELATAVSNTDHTLAEFSRKRVAELGGEIFDVKRPVQVARDQATWTASAPLLEKVREFQRESRLPPTGILDRPTLGQAVARESGKSETITTTTTGPR